MSDLCICEFPDTCNGLGVVYCDGCGGDFCACMIHGGNGEESCDGCAACLADEDMEIEVPQGCRLCGCTAARACPGGCYWVEVDLCSACAPG